MLPSVTNLDGLQLRSPRLKHVRPGLDLSIHSYMLPCRKKRFIPAVHSHALLRREKVVIHAVYKDFYILRHQTPTQPTKNESLDYGRISRKSEEEQSLLIATQLQLK